MTVERDWHPIASSTDLPHRHAHQAQLLGRELVAWRADDDFVNVWEDRCLHRGLRLSIGTNDGWELRCQYHGWRYASRTAGCTYIPAHPADAPARTICNRVFPSIERYGLVWTTFDPGSGTELEPIEALDAGAPFPLRPVEVWAPADDVRHRIAELDLGDGGRRPLFFVQPVGATRCVVRGVLDRRPAEGDELDVLRRHNTALTNLRDRIEAEIAATRLPDDALAELPDLPVELIGLPPLARDRVAPLRVEVVRRWDTAIDIAGFDLEPLGSPLPTFQPGAHIDLHLPNGLVRQYSLINGPGDQGRYRIGVKLEPDSTGGSRCLHDEVREGDVLAVSEPRNNFPLRRDAVRTLLIAGGIGLTPLLSMARALLHGGSPFELHVFARSPEHVPFRDELASLGPSLTHHVGLGPDETGRRLAELLDGYGEANHVYLCGPPPMLEVARRAASEAGWPDEAVHFEYFANPTEVDKTSAFSVALARSALTLDVVPGQTLLEAIRAAGVGVPSSCEQGACGTCVVGVIDGVPDHQDVYLNESERRAGDRVVTCVSRSLTERLVLDI